ncbi:glutathione S-transferase [Hyphomonas polymorpha PS728]|uniref:Glutathione S-transferase n=1 Tax=Hyphomonas polymorpha PS728 TaxID=1280954 RepID=A0A062VF33_9PROT|nr:glutathione S-transferase [Hyphomonas polymorpha PS728]
MILKATGAPFEEELIEVEATEGRQFSPQAKRAFITKLGEVSPNARLPVLWHNDLLVWDTASIAEYLNELYPEANLWPSDPVSRAIARSVTAEMHSCFLALRRECRMDIFLRTNFELQDEKSHNDVRRMVRLYSSLRKRFKDRGAFLLGPWSIADAFVLPEATRLRSYGISLREHGDEDGIAQAYSDTLLATPHYLEWEGLSAPVA